MKTTGIIIVVWGALCIILALLLMTPQDNVDIDGNRIWGGMMLIVCGSYLIHRDKKKQKQKIEFDKWNNSSEEQ